MTREERIDGCPTAFGRSGTSPAAYALAGLAMSVGLALHGCASSSPPAATDKFAETPGSAASGATQEVTDLSTISDASVPAIAPLPKLQPVATPSSSSIGSSPSANTPRNEELTQSLAANAPASRWNVEPNKFKGGSRLLNDKARQYAEFADILLDQTLKAAQTLAPDKLGQHRVPVDLVPTTLTAVMDPLGRLKEIVIEQHSGDLNVDKLFIEACKQGIWSRNPPPGARASDGTYRLRVEGSIYNQTYDRYGQYSYDTELALGIL